MVLLLYSTTNYYLLVGAFVLGSTFVSMKIRIGKRAALSYDDSTKKDEEGKFGKKNKIMPLKSELVNKCKFLLQVGFLYFFNGKMQITLKIKINSKSFYFF